MHLDTFRTRFHLPEDKTPVWKTRVCIMAYHMAYLVSKLIAGHTQDNEPLVCVATVELVHLSIVPGCCSSERRHIFNQHHFPF